jgi:hypothetical protein
MKWLSGAALGSICTPNLALAGDTNGRGAVARIVSAAITWLADHGFAAGPETTLEEVHSQGFDLLDSIEMAVHLYEHAEATPEAPKAWESEWGAMHWNSTLIDYANNAARRRVAR